MFKLEFKAKLSVRILQKKRFSQRLSRVFFLKNTSIALLQLDYLYSDNLKAYIFSYIIAAFKFQLLNSIAKQQHANSLLQRCWRFIPHVYLNLPTLALTYELEHWISWRRCSFPEPIHRNPLATDANSRKATFPAKITFAWILLAALCLANTWAIFTGCMKVPRPTYQARQHYCKHIQDIKRK